MSATESPLSQKRVCACVPRSSAGQTWPALASGLWRGVCPCCAVLAVPAEVGWARTRPTCAPVRKVAEPGLCPPFPGCPGVAAEPAAGRSLLCLPGASWETSRCLLRSSGSEAKALSLPSALPPASVASQCSQRPPHRPRVPEWARSPEDLCGWVSQVACHAAMLFPRSSESQG